MKYSLGRWSGEAIAVHNGDAHVGSINLQNVFNHLDQSWHHQVGFDKEHLKKFHGKKFESHMDCLDYLNGEKNDN